MDKELKNELRRDEIGEAVQEARGLLSRPEVVKPALAVLALFLVLLGLYSAQRYRASSAEAAFARASEVYHAEVDADSPGPSATGEKYKTAAEKFEKAKGLFEEVARKYGSSPAGKRARYYAGLCLIELGRYADAEAALKVVAAERNPAAIEPMLAKVRLGELLMLAKRHLDAANYFDALTKEDGNGIPRDQLLFSFAAALEAAGRKPEARRAYMDLVNRHPQSPFVRDARPKIDALATL